MLSKAIQLAAYWHKGQVDKGGAPYILHPLRVMLAMEDPTDKIVAVLHDILEDTDLKPDDLRAHKFSAEVRDAVQALTRQDGEDYFDFVRRAAANPIARRVKLADIADNLDPARIIASDPNGPSRRQRYKKARSMLLEVGQ
ncbi:GTP pyrophosphokinase [Rhizobium sp. CNPSo 4062]|uniref:GTP pyrophosphokinase n=1 Tax=Rhizobium sp. CNPSo 4062 TaxID=3021410 RepID=UPI00254A4717|nr:GTP pyrophosphokinase [Rhizobium sp. CNPSo 4062]MDK4703851.1 GTP pyrophosphokinase [Rhizobium sp. CNPSo 4062]